MNRGNTTRNTWNTWNVRLLLMNDRFKIPRRCCTCSRDFPFHLNGRRFCFSSSLLNPSIQSSLSFTVSRSFYPWTVAPKSSSKHNNRVWRGSGVQPRRCWKVWLARCMEKLVPWTRREIAFRGWYSAYVFSGMSTSMDTAGTFLIIISFRPLSLSLSLSHSFRGSKCAYYSGVGSGWAEN